MKIIKRGNMPEEVTIMCPYCSCQFIAERRDIDIISRQYVDNKIIPWGQVNCPDCGFPIEFNRMLNKVGG